jgi:hypothetical protein
VTVSDGVRPARDRGEADTVTDESESSLDTSEDSDWSPSDGFELARAKANENLAAALVQLGWSADGARVLARASVKPDDVRRRLAAPVELRVPGGTLLVVESPVYSLGVTSYPTNLREIGNRIYPLGIKDNSAVETLIADPVASPDTPAELVLDVRDQDQLSEHLRSSEAWLRRRNPLAGDISVEGVLQPVTVVGMRVDHRNGAPSVHLLTAADGSSRTAGTHKILEADPADLVYGTGSSDRLLRQHIGNILRPLHERGWVGLTEEERRHVRAVTMPARIVIGYRQESGRGVGFDAAVRSLIGLMHIAPPLPYGAEVERDATADAVLDALQRPYRGRQPRISNTETRWFAAVMSQAERQEVGLSGHPDVRAAEIVRALLYGGRRTALRVNAGIRSITARSSPTPDDRVAIAVELILRPWRTAHAGDEHRNLTARRSAMQRAFGLPQIAQQSEELLLEGTADSPFTLEDLRSRALAEAEAGQGRRNDQALGSAQVELAVKAAYYLILSEPMGLRREAPPNVKLADGRSDQRSPSVVLTAMLATKRGVRQAYAVIVHGRVGEPLWEVGEDGKPATDENNKLIVLTNERLRNTYGGHRPPPEPRGGLAEAEHRWQDLGGAIILMERATSALAAVRSTTGRSYLDEEGWPADEVDAMRRRLDQVDHRLRGWEDRWITHQNEKVDDDGDNEYNDGDNEG